MSRHRFSNQAELIALINICCTHAAEKAFRALIVIEMAPDLWLEQLASDYSIPFIQASETIDRADQISSVLGTERSLVIHQLSERFDAGLLAAVTGTIRAGGALVLGISPLTRSYFFQRFQKIFCLLSGRYPEILVEATFRHAPDQQQSRHRLSREEPPITKTPLPPLPAKQEQDLLLELACQFLKQHNKACILITGRRGRGKSTLMARIANRLEQDSLDYSLSAANQAGLSTFFKCSPSARQAFVSPDKASSSVISKRLLVEEAGSLPLATLLGFLDSYEQVILCTTVEGYEIGGRAFEIRFAPQIRIEHSHVLDLNPVEPWRWSGTDPLEQMLDQLLLTEQANLTQDLTASMKSSIAPPGSVAQDSVTSHNDQHKTLQPTISMIPRLIEQTELAQNEHTLKNLFTLLRNTHYQTSIQDLEHLLDSSDIQIWVIEAGQTIVAAVVLTLEGQIDSDLHEPVVSKTRRLPHQLLPQLLAQSANMPDALRILYARVIRISVIDSLRRTGMASQLIHCIETHIRQSQNNSMAMGASFAADAASIAFWQANGYAEFHRGFKPNPRTGKNAVAVIKAWGTTASDVVNQATLIHADNTEVRNHLTHSSATRSSSLYSCARDGSTGEPRMYDFALLTRFAAAQRSLNDTLGPLNRLAMRHEFLLHEHTRQNRRQYEQSLRESVADLLVNWP